ncbi:6-phosphogluconate dehydrogenase C-terminal domain-like protein [Guyanagaster necrorhizus]|uniref:6-phosphogluconate dehydrogenase C-terminal domain-like protein n=1 Tax=Guyanagaster necrorhizus TaxID=856835 RepID=A0A9P8AXJ8_9AGAR|nr:6-phosphogluconate dehydrogenase C-terminal domain-like protein [Guyanagaster necrorhizus MCA 3950]KAG7451683.1 6-phosphogluconate dehydrogenase C-terminal domain-like protein [Guyanagaster necrorhizus MCA 3950]
MAPKDVLLVGFGAVGAVYSLIFKKSGLARVTAVARSNYHLVNEHGMHFKSRKYGDIPGWRPDRLCSSVASAADQRYDYVVLTTKAVPELIKTPEILEPLLSAPYSDKYPQPIYVLIQNGLGVEVDLYNAIKSLGKGPPQIISTSVFIATNLLAPNVVQHGAFDRPTLGMYRYRDFTTIVNTPEEDSILRDIGGMLEKGGSTVTLVSEIQRLRFAKNFWNVAFSSLATLTGYTPTAIFRPLPSDPAVPYETYVYPKTAHLINESTIPNVKAVLTELMNLGRAMGFPDTEDGLPSSLVEGTVERTRVLHIEPDHSHKPSMMLDAEKSLPIEVEVILGEVVRLAKEYKVDIPRIEMMYSLLLVVQNQILRKLGK